MAFYHNDHRPLGTFLHQAIIFHNFIELLLRMPKIKCMWLYIDMTLKTKLDIGPVKPTCEEFRKAEIYFGQCDTRAAEFLLDSGIYKSLSIPRHFKALGLKFVRLDPDGSRFSPLSETPAHSPMIRREEQVQLARGLRSPLFHQDNLRRIRIGLE